MRRLVLYSRTDCHLCEDMLEHLGRLAEHHPFRLEVREVDDDPTWQRDYGHRVPLLYCDGEEVCEYFLDEAGLVARLKAH